MSYLHKKKIERCVFMFLRQVCWGIIYMQWNVPFQWVVLWVLTNKTAMEPQSKYRTRPSAQKMFCRRFSKRWLESLDRHSVTQQALATAAVTLMGWSPVLLFALSARGGTLGPFPCNTFAVRLTETQWKISGTLFQWKTAFENAPTTNVLQLWIFKFMQDWAFIF